MKSTAQQAATAWPLTDPRATSATSLGELRDGVGNPLPPVTPPAPVSGVLRRSCPSCGGRYAEPRSPIDQDYDACIRCQIRAREHNHPLDRSPILVPADKLAADRAHRLAIRTAVQEAAMPRPRALDDDQAAEAALRYAAGESLVAIATRFGCSDKSVRSAIDRHEAARTPARGAAAEPGDVDAAAAADVEPVHALDETADDATGVEDEDSGSGETLAGEDDETTPDRPQGSSVSTDSPPLPLPAVTAPLAETAPTTGAENATLYLRRSSSWLDTRRAVDYQRGYLDLLLTDLAEREITSDEAEAAADRLRDRVERNITRLADLEAA